MRYLSTVLGLIVIGSLTLQIPAALAGQHWERKCQSPYHSAEHTLTAGEADHHLRADTIHSLPRDIAWFFPRDKSRYYEKIAIYGSETVDIRQLHFRQIRVGKARTRPMGFWKVYYDLDRDGRSDLIFVVRKKRLGTEQGDRFLPITAHTVGSAPPPNSPASPMIDTRTASPVSESLTNNSSPSVTVMAAAPLGASAEIASALFEAVAGSTIDTVTSTGVGFALSALGVGIDSSSPEVDLAPVIDELATISNQIGQLGSELDQGLTLIETELKTLDCDNQFSIISEDIAQIKSWANTLKSWAERPSKGIGLPESSCTEPDIENCVEALVDDVLSDSNNNRSLNERLTRIHTQLIGGVGGLIKACVAAISTPDQGTLDDRDYYASVQNLSHYFFGIQVQALNLYAEARHFRAWQHYISDGNPKLAADLVPGVCSNATAGSPAQAQCELVKEQVHRVYARLQSQYALAGAPYSQSNLVIVNGFDTLWPLNLDDFRKNDGYTNCSSPLTSAVPCGAVAGSWKDSDFMAKNGNPIAYAGSSEVGFAGYEGWQVAGKQEWSDLLASSSYNKNQSIETYLKNDMGFSFGTANQIFLTGDTSALNGSTVVAWLDTGFVWNQWDFINRMPPWDGSHAFDGLYSNYNDTRGTATCMFNGAASYLPQVTANHSFYAGYHQQSAIGDDGNPCPLFYPNSKKPGILTSENRVQLRYPVLDINALSCGDEPLLCGGARRATNPGGMPSICGADFDAYFEQIAPQPENYSDAGC
ncbi:MAG: hypothetical protein GY814_16870 [Gammaproteobacteria bacterium]|nr:hypothetical protein [Gammaproteobacteria bacterium]